MLQRFGWLSAVAAMVVLLGGCPSRVQLYSPRIPGTPQHQQAVQQKNCLECHQTEKLKHHSRGDDCTTCHLLCRGC